MKTKSLKRSIGSGMAFVVVLGMLAALPAQAGSGLIKITHSATPSKWSAQPVRKAVAKAEPKSSQTPAEVQVGVMVKSPARPAARRSVFIHR
jgi:hypothetical protein